MHDPLDHDNHDHEQFDGFTIEDIKKNFKALGRELEEGGSPLKEVIEEAEEYLEESPGTSHFRGYIPTIKDYLARASTHDECEEIIAYCLRQGEITEDEAEHYRHRLARGGPRAFGTRKPGYYDQKL